MVLTCALCVCSSELPRACSDHDLPTRLCVFKCAFPATPSCEACQRRKLSLRLLTVHLTPWVLFACSTTEFSVEAYHRHIRPATNTTETPCVAVAPLRPTNGKNREGERCHQESTEAPKHPLSTTSTRKLHFFLSSAVNTRCKSSFKSMLLHQLDRSDTIHQSSTSISAQHCCIASRLLRASSIKARQSFSKLSSLEHSTQAWWLMPACRHQKVHEQSSAKAKRSLIL